MAESGSHDASHLVNGDAHVKASEGDLKFESNFSDIVSAGQVNAAFEESSTDPLPNENFYQNGGYALNGTANVDQTKSVQNITAEPDTSVSISQPVVFENRGGHHVVFQERVMTAQPDGSMTIQTRAIPERGRQFQRPLRAKRILFIKIFSVISAVIFPPTGIPACYYAFKTKKAFDEGILQGNIDLAVKYSTRAERLIIVSIIFAIVAGALALAMWERAVNARDYAWHPGVVIGG